MKKKILIDASTIPSHVDGLSVYIINLVKFLPEDSFNHFEFTILIDKGLEREEFTSFIKNSRLHILEAKIAPIGPKRDWDMYWFLRKHEKDFDLVHITSNNFPLSLNRGVCTIHDITFKRYFDNPKLTVNLAPFYMDWVLRNCMKKATAVIAVSNSTKNELINIYQLDQTKSKKIHVIYEGWEHIAEVNKEKESTTNVKFPLDSNYLFYLGTFRKHKNIPNLLLAFKIALDRIPRHIKLAISGNNKHMNESDLRLFNEINKTETRVFFTGYLNSDNVELFYRNADAFILPSFSEGFGFPILEAFYYNCPVLCSNTTSLPEVAGDAAIYFDPSDPADIAKAIVKLYDDPSLAQKLKKAGKERLSCFSWSKAADQTVKVYKQCLNL